jgi:hypothetical protein
VGSKESGKAERRMRAAIDSEMKGVAGMAIGTVVEMGTVGVIGIQV